MTQTMTAEQPQENPMSEFERRIREMALLTPAMPLRTAITLAERGSDEIPYPADSSDSDALAMWASQKPEVMNYMVEHKFINAIGAMRQLAAAEGHTLGLRDAKDAMDTLKVM